MNKIKILLKDDEIIEYELIEELSYGAKVKVDNKISLITWNEIRVITYG